MGTMRARRRLSLACALVLLSHAAWAKWGTWSGIIVDCEYDLGFEQCLLCQGRWSSWNYAIDPAEPTCIHTAEGCCHGAHAPWEEDVQIRGELRYEYFLKDSLANYKPGKSVSFFYPDGDMIHWVPAGSGFITLESTCG